MPEAIKPGDAVAPADQAQTPPPPITPPTADELEAQRKEFMASMFDKPEKAKEAEKPAEEPKPEIAKAPEKPAEAPPEKLVEVAVEDEPDEPIALRPSPVADLPDAPAEEKLADDTLTAGDRRKLDALRHLESLRPEYKGVADKTAKFWKAEQDYEQTWKRNPENKGRKFDPADDEHEEFYATNEPVVDSDDLDEARVDLKVGEKMRQAEERLKNRVDPEIEEIKAQNQMRQAKPRIKQAAEDAQTGVFMAIPEFADILKSGDKVVHNDETEAKLEEKYPALYDVVATEAEKAMLVSAEIAKFKAIPNYRLNESLPMNVRGEAFRPHAEITNTFYDLEDAVAAAPKAKQIHNGREFARYAELETMKQQVFKSPLAPQAKQAKLKEIADRYYTITLDDVAARVRANAARKVTHARTVWEKESKLRAPISSQEPKQGEPLASGAGVKSSKPQSVATSSVSDSVDNAGLNGGGKPNSQKEFENAMFG